MKNSFWISLLFFILLMCACKTKKVGSEINFTTKENVQTECVKYHALVDTSNVLKTIIDKSRLSIIETITITEYDKNTGMVEKTTKTERTIVQDTDKASTEEEQRAVVEESVDSVSNNLFTETELVEDIREESIGVQESFGKWLAIVLGIGIVIGIIYLWRKIRVR